MAVEHSFKPGTIKSIELVNFMCHDSFKLSLGPRVNFIIGCNGSGKSAILTAIVIALGGRATLTLRAKRLSDFIKTGKRTAEIVIKIHNYDKVMEKEKAYKPDDYGKEIIIQKTITRDDSSRLALRSDRSKKVSERKAELDEMLDHFGILINNPICILNQEVSKTFLHSKRPEDKFDLFMKATNLESIANDYDEAGESHQSWKECNETKTLSFKLLESEYQSCKEKSSFLENRAKLNDMRASLNTELIYAITRDNEENVSNLEKAIQDITEKIEEQEKVVADREKKKKRHAEEIQLSQSKKDDSLKECDDAKRDLEDIQSKEMAEKQNQIGIESNVESCRRRIRGYEADKIDLEKSITEVRQQLESQNNNDQDMERRRMELERLEREIPAELAREKTIRQGSHQLDASMMQIREEIQNYNFKCNGLKDRLAMCNAHLRRLKNGQEDSLRKYGDPVIKVRQKIEELRARFKRKPIGPLGYHLKLKEQAIAPALEILLGKNALAFVCDNSQDMAVLNQIIKDCYRGMPHARQPIVIARKYGRRHDTGRSRARHDHYKTFLDCLHIQEDCVYNALVDRCALEQVLFIPDFYEAENLLINPSSVPPNTRFAYTKDCYCIHPNINDNNYKCFANDSSRCMLFKDNNSHMIREQEKEIDNVKAQIRDLEKIFQDVKKNYDEQKSERESNDKEIRRIVDLVRSKEEQLLALKTVVVKEPQELSSLEDELGLTIERIAREKLDLQNHLEKLRQLDEDLSNVISKRKIRHDKLKKLEAKMSQICKIIQGHQDSISSCDKTIKEANTKIENLTKEKDEVSRNLHEALDKVARSQMSIPQDIQRPSVIRSTETIREELRKVDAQLRVDMEEMQDPEEMKRSLLKRMKEIESLTELKDLNLKNYSFMKKLLSEKKEGLANLRQSTVSSVATTFATVMRTMKMTGELHIHLNDVKEGGITVKKKGTLEMRVDTNYTQTQKASSTQVMNESSNNHRSSRSQPPPKRRCQRELDDGKENEVTMTDTRSLSGGERSFSTVAFVLALWHHCASPFKLMDEIDVFMDMVTRRVSYNALIRYAEVSHDPGQFIFFSPLELPKFEDHGSYVKIFEMPTVVRKRAVPTQDAE